MSALIISGVGIRQDEYSRYCLNDLHRAAGGEAKDKPGNWLMLEQTKALINEIKIAGFPAIQSKQGLGTFVAKELVYSYAMWISAAFNLKVIRGYDSMVNQQEQPSLLPSMPELQIAESAARMLRMSDTSKLRMLNKICEEKGLSTQFLPAYSDEKLTRSLTDLLKEHNSKLSARAVNPILIEMGIIEVLQRPSTGKSISKFKSLTDAGLKYGKNETCPENPKETHPRYYVHLFGNLLALINQAMFVDAA